MLMRSFFCLLFFFLLVGPVFGKCASEALWVYPSKKEVPENARFIVNAYGKAKTLVDSLERSYSVFLETEGHRVDLKVVERNRGNGMDQALLVPEDLLKPGKEYRLRIPDLGDREEPLLRSYDGEAEEHVWSSWRVVEGKDEEPPDRVQRPELLERSYQMLGCGPEAYAVFKMEAADRSGVWVKVEMKEAKTGTVDRYILPLKEKKLKVGHNMCSGAFSYASEGKYGARFKLMDHCGNELGEWTRWISYRSPEEDSGG